MLPKITFLLTVIRNKEICNTMTKQSNAQYSNNINKGKTNDDMILDSPPKDDITDIINKEEDIKKAIEK